MTYMSDFIDQSSFLCIMNGWLLVWLLAAEVYVADLLSTQVLTNQIARFQAEGCTERY